LASIADVYVTVLPETGKIADGIKSALLKADVHIKAAAQRWKKEIEDVLDDVEVKAQLKVDSAKAKAQIDKATQNQQTTVQVTANTAKANAQINHAARNRTSNVNVNVNKGAGVGILGLAANLTAQGFGAMSTGAQGASTAMQTASTAAKGLSTTTTAMGIAVAAAVPALFALAGVATAASGALLLLPAAFAAVGAGAGVLTVGLSGITDAYEAVSGAAKSAGKDAADHASKVTSASRSVTSAQQSLTSAVRSERQAQQDVARARRDALHELQDINDELRNGAIDETQANLDLAKARQELATGTFDSSLDYQQAQLNVIKAEQRAKEAHEQNADAIQNAADKQAKGVEGADAVVAAEQRLADAQQNTANAQTALADAQTELAKANSDVSTSAQKAADAMGLLAPAGQEFINALMALTPVWNQFKQDLQQPLLTGLGETLTNTVNAVLPAVMPGLQRIAGAFNTMFGQVGEWLQKPENLAMISGIVDNIAAAFEQLTPAIQPFMTAIGTLTSVGSDFLPGFAHAIADGATAFAQFVSEGEKSGMITEFIEKAIFIFQELGKLMPSILWAFGRFADLGVNAMPGLVDVLNGLIYTAGFIAPAFTAPFDIIHGIVVATGAVFDWLKGVIVGAIQVAGDIIAWFKEKWDEAGRVIDAVKGILAGVWQSLEQNFPLIKRLGDAFKNVWDFIKGIFDTAKGWLQDFFKWVWDGINGMLPDWVKNFLGIGNGGTYVPPANSGLPAPAPGQVNSTQGGNRTSLAPAVVQPGGSVIPGLPAPTSTTGDGTRVFVTNWPAGGLGGGGGAVTTTALPGVNPAPGGGGGVPVIPDPNRPGFFTSSNPEWAKLIKRESGGAPAVTQTISDVNSASGDLAKGLFQITDATWKANGGTEFAPTAREATPEQQGIVAGRIFAKSGGQPWGATPGGGREDEAALRAGLAPGTSPTVPSPAAAPGAPVTTSVTAVPGEQIGTTATRQHIEQTLGMHIGSGWRQPDTFDEHSGGNAFDTMVSSKAEGDRVAAEALAQPNVDYVIWQQATRYKDGRVVPMEDRGNPTANHMDHVHVHVVSTGYAPGNEPETTGKPRGANAATYPSSPNLTAANAGAGTGTPSGPIQLNPNIPPGQQGAKDKGKDYGKDLGQNIISGMMEVFGLGDIFPDPTQFGLFKIFKSLLQIKPGGATGTSNGGSTNATTGSGSGGNPFLDLLGSLIPGGPGSGGLGALSAWTPPPGSPASGTGTGPAPGPTVNNTVTVEGNIDNPTLNKVDTLHTSDLRNMPGK
jgi:Transglycosylase-like domain